MAISDDMQRMMPTDEDRSAGQVLDYKEAVLLTHPSNPKLKGEVRNLIYSTKSINIFTLSVYIN